MILQPSQFATKSLSPSQRGDDICQILAASVNSANPEMAVHNCVSLDRHRLVIGNNHYELDQYEHVIVIGAGKASVPMAITIQEILGHWITDGRIITKKGYLEHYPGLNITPLPILEASHPIPDQSNLDASNLLMTLIHDLQKNDLVICLISGGASALMMKPSPGISLKDIQVITQLLLSCGADIGEINTIRKHLDEFKGGGLAKIVFPATIVSLIISDVVGDQLDRIASGPTVADPTTYHDAWSIIEKYQLLDKIPARVSSHLQAGMAEGLPETIKPGDRVLDHVYNIIIGSNPHALKAAQDEAMRLGFHPRLLTSSLQGEASQAGQSLARDAISLLSLPTGLIRPACLIAGGETTVTLHGSGKGGRNQEFALSTVNILSGDEPLILVSLGTDGADGPTDAAGAVATNQTYTAGLLMGLDPLEYLANNDSYHYFERLGGLIITGPTLTNVNDLVLLFAL